MIVVLVLIMTMALDAQKIQVHGHRGARAVLPENTLPAFEYAIAVGADVLELDLAVTKDDVLVVSHDPAMNAAFCKGPGKGPSIIREMTLAQLRLWDCGSRANPQYPKQQAKPGTRVPTLDEVLALAGKGSFQFNIETKIFADRPHLTPSPEKYSRLVAEAIQRRNMVDRVIVQSFDFRTLHAMKKILPGVRLSALYERGPKDFVSIAKEAGGAGIVSPQYKLITPAKVDAAHAAGLQVVPWTANSVADWEDLVRAKVDAIISDDPAELIRYLKAKGLR